ncbi:MAG: hypothetical protein IJR45_06335, partial [Firmicutes bacterium]|nr:hypothetical protein [Bacillota bacterium]
KFFTIALISAFLFTGCQGGNSSNSNTVASDETMAVTEESIEETTEEITEIDIETTEETSELKTENTEEAKTENWSIIELHDEFETPIGEYRLYGKSKDGKFSNSATTNSNLTAAIGFDYSNSDGEAYCEFFLYEYGSQQVNEKCSYNVTILDTNSNKHNMAAGSIGGGYIFLLDEYYAELVEIMKSPGTVKVYMEEKTNNYGAASTYLFSFDTTDFADKYQEWVTKIYS